MKERFLALLFFTMAFVQFCYPQTKLLRNPDISFQNIVFEYAGDIWIANLDGSDPRRLTISEGRERHPYFSNDGRHICFTAEYDGNTDVYMLPIEGGNPRRMTWHPSPDHARGWSNDDKVLFASSRANVPEPILEQFWSVDKAGGMPERVVVPRVNFGEFNYDGSLFAYQMVLPWENEFRHYRGGQNNPIRILSMDNNEVEKIPWNGSMDRKPAFIDNEVFFISDRDTISNVWSYDVLSKRVRQRTFFKKFDTKHIGSGGGKLIIENGGSLHILNPEDDSISELRINIKADFPNTRSQWKNLRNDIQNASLSPTGQKAVFSARGDIFTVPVEGVTKNITQSHGVADRYPAWSPNGNNICWFSDESGEYQLLCSDENGSNLRKFPLRNKSFYYDPVWSPDSKMLSFSDADRNLWVLTLETAELRVIANERFDHPIKMIHPAWSPDSKYIAYAAGLENEYYAIFIYSIAQKKSYQITDGLADCISPAWDKNGRYIYFLASTDYGSNLGWMDMSSFYRSSKYGVYMALLDPNEASPLIPKLNGQTSEVVASNAPSVKENSSYIDFADLASRIIPLDISPKLYKSITSGKGNTIYLAVSTSENTSSYNLEEYNIAQQKLNKVIDNINGHAVSFDGDKLLYQSGNKWAIGDVAPNLAGGSVLKLSDLKLKLSPKEEWRQIFKEAIRYQRDFFYVENVHGLNLTELENTYYPWVDHINHRSDLNYLLDIIGGETVVGHSLVGGGDIPKMKKVSTGLLGADYGIKNGHYQIIKIYRGENWNPFLRSPLGELGTAINEGDFILSVNGNELRSSVNIYSLFAQTTGKTTILEINDKPSFDGAKKIAVIPIADENALRQKEWIKKNTEMVNELSGGKLAYMWLPSTDFRGFVSFNRHYFSKKHKKGFIVDARFNAGGVSPDYIIDIMSRELMGYFNNSVGKKQPFTSPGAAFYGPKVLLINERAGSGGDYLPYMFRKRGTGPIVGTKTWGALVGAAGIPPLLDGGYITAPRWGFFSPEGKWDIENVGVSPDYSVEQNPTDVIKGKDPQLEKAVQLALDLIEKQEFKLMSQPADPFKIKEKKIR